MSITEGQDKRRTDATRFLLRGIGLDKGRLEALGFINAYIDDKNHDPHYEDSLYLLFQPKDLSLLEKFLRQERERTHLLLEEYDYPRGYVVAVYKFPSEFMREYRLFFQGKYSQFSEKYISLFPMTRKKDGKLGENPTFWDHVFHKSKYMREYWESKLDVVLDEDSEYWSIPNREKETLDIHEFYK